MIPIISTKLHNSVCKVIRYLSRAVRNRYQFPNVLEVKEVIKTYAEETGWRITWFGTK